MNIIAITTTKTARHKDSAEFFLTDFGGDYDATLEAARKAHPRKRKFFHLKGDGVRAMTEPFKV